MKINFIKMEGLGNDFIFIDDREESIGAQVNFSELSKKICSRRFGIGADGIIIINDSKINDFKFTIYNSDGSQPQMCGNGMRCFAKYLYENKITSKKKIEVETKAGTIIPEVFIDDNDKVESVRVDMGEPVLIPSKIPFITQNQRAIKERLIFNDDDSQKDVEVTVVSMGNPHAVVFVDDIRNINVKSLGQKIENHERFPEKTNVEFIEPVKEDELIMKVWERGAGQTLACGTGACGALVASYLNKKCHNKVLIHLDGGDLEIEWDLNNNHIYKTGPASFVFSGSVTI
ncbi:MAG: diaminopimelate epimerase [Desulfobacteraceae bacterium]|nr:diaminopimelate epimerase [Desulfobacteraceae bacterium]